MTQLDAPAAAEAIRADYEKRPGTDAAQLHKEIFLLHVADALKTEHLPSNLAAIAKLLETAQIETPFAEYPKWVEHGKVDKDEHGNFKHPDLPPEALDFTIDKDGKVFIIVDDPAKKEDQKKA